MKCLRIVMIGYAKLQVSRGNYIITLNLKRAEKREHFGFSDTEFLP